MSLTVLPPIRRPGLDDAARASWFEQTLVAYARHLTAAGNTHDHIAGDLAVVRDLVRAAQAYPCDWRREDVDAWSAALFERNERTTIRAKQLAIAHYLDYLLDPLEDWAPMARERFGVTVVQLVSNVNAVPHVSHRDAHPDRRAPSLAVLLAFFGELRAEYERKKRAHSKGAITVLRDIGAFGLYAAFGPREEGLRMADVDDFAPSPEPSLRLRYGNYGQLTVRYGKAKRRGPKRTYTVFAVPCLEFGPGFAAHYIERVRPEYRCKPGSERALFLTERGGRPSRAYFSKRFSAYRDEYGFDKNIVLHGLRHWFATYQLEAGHDHPFVSSQLGHESLVSIDPYAHLSASFLRSQLRKAVMSR